MHTIRSIVLLAFLLLLALPASALDTYQFTINKNSPHTTDTGLILQSGDRILIQAEGAMKVINRPFTDGWFDPSGLGRLDRGGQIFSDSSYGMVIGSYYGSLTSGFVAGDLASFTTPSAAIGNELKIGVNMSAGDLALVEGAFKVHITRFNSSEADEVTLIIDADSPQVVSSGLISNPGDQFLVIGQGAARVPGFRPVTDGWFDASGLGILRRGGQIFSDTPYGSLLGTFSNTLGSGFSVGDGATWDTQSADYGDDLKFGLNMDADDLASMQGSIVVNILRISSGGTSSVTDGPVPNALVSLGNFPNPFNPRTTVSFELNSPQMVRLSIVNLAGEIVQTLSSQTYPAGNHHLSWDGNDSQGKGQASGTYFLRLETKESVKNHKLTLVR